MLHIILRFVNGVFDVNYVRISGPTRDIKTVLGRVRTSKLCVFVCYSFLFPVWCTFLHCITAS